jgi:hypothetical protein
MSKIISKLNWRELFFPVLSDLKNINEETDSARVSRNNWTLANNNDDYEKVIKLIKKNRSSENSEHNIIIID